MYGKLIKGNFIKAKYFITTDKETILNPTDEMYEKHGFKKVIEDEMPELNENQSVEIYYEDCPYDEALGAYVIVLRADEGMTRFDKLSLEGLTLAELEVIG